MDREHKLYKDAISGLMPDFEDVRRRAKRGNEKISDSECRFPRWMMPAVSAVCMMGLVCLLIPPVRASLVNLFHGGAAANTAAYLNLPQYERPEMKDVSVQIVSARPWRIRTYQDTTIPWGSDIQYAGIKEALYDGGSGELTLKYAVDGAACGVDYAGNILAAGSLNERSVQENRTFPCILDAQLVEDASALISFEDFAEAAYPAPMGVTHLAKDTLADSRDGVITLTSVFGLTERASENELVLLIPCVAAHPTEDNTGLDYEHLGCIEIPFRIHAEQSIRKTAATGIYTVGGMPVDITEAVLSPTGLRIAFEVPHDALTDNLDFNIFADGELLTPGTGTERVSYLDYRMSDSSPTTEGLIRIPFADTDISSVVLFPCDQGTGEAMTDEAIELTFE